LARKPPSAVQQYDDVVSLIYEAASDATLWRPVMLATADLLHSGASTLVFAGTPLGAGDIVEVVRFDPVVQQQFLRRRHAEDFWWRAFNGRPTGHISRGTDLISVKEMEATALYQDLCRPIDAHYLLAGVAEATAEHSTMISFLRGKDCGNFTAQEELLLRMLLPHMRRAVHFHRNLGVFEARSERLAHVLDKSRAATFVVDRLGRVLHLNAAAQALVGTDDGVSVVCNVLRTSGCQGSLQSALLRMSEIGSASGGEFLTVPRSSGKRAFQVLIMPLNQRTIADSWKNSPVSVILIRDPEDVSSPPAALLRTAYQLTPSEIALLEDLCNGLSLAESAEQRQRSIHTVRVQLKACLHKCGARTQADLMRILMTDVMRPNNKNA
jgi:DNA-binding CsgD family transcriptional regulator/PAS domain-containing protein